MIMALEFCIRPLGLQLCSFPHNNGARNPSPSCNLTCNVSQHSVMAMSKIQNAAEGGKSGKRPTLSQKRRPGWRRGRLPFVEEQLRIIREHEKVEMIDIDRLMTQSDNRFALVKELADEATEYQLKNRDCKSPILKVLSDRMNDDGFDRPDSYFVDERHNVIPETWDRIYDFGSTFDRV